MHKTIKNLIELEKMKRLVELQEKIISSCEMRIAQLELELMLTKPCESEVDNNG